MSVKTKAKLTCINSFFGNYLAPTSDDPAANIKNLRFFMFSTQQIYLEKELDDDVKEKYRALVNETCQLGHTKTNDAIAYCIDLLKKNDIEVPAYTKNDIIKLIKYFPEKDKIEPFEIEIMFDINLIWLTAELLSKAQYLYALTKYGRHLNIIKSKQEKNYLERLYYRPTGRVFFEAYVFQKENTRI